MINRVNGFQYTPETQKQMVALLLQDPTALPKLRGAINPSFFENAHHAAISKEIVTYFDSYSKPPTLPELRDRLITLSGQEKKGGVVDTLTEIGETRIPNPTELFTKVTRFAVRQSVLDAIDKIAIMVDGDDDLMEAPKILETAVTSAGATDDDGVSFKNSLADLANELKTSKLYNPSFKVSLGLNGLNRLTRGGGGAGELYVVAAPPKRGKSTFLTYVGGHAAMCGRNVLHVSLENKRLDCQVNYCSSLVNLPREIIATAAPETVDLLSQLYSVMTGDIHIKYFPPGELSAEKLKSYIMYLRSAKNFKADMLIIDYPDRMKLHNYKDVYNSLGLLYDQIIAMLDRFEMFGLVATQINREGSRKTTAGGGEVGESFKKVQNLDGLIVLNQTEEERTVEPKQIRICLDMARRAIPGVVRCEVNYACCRFKEMPDVETC